MDMLEALVAKVNELSDREAVRQCLNRYARGVDRFDRDLVLSAFHPDCLDEHGKFVGFPEEFVEWGFNQHRSAHLFRINIASSITAVRSTVRRRTRKRISSL